MLQRPVASGRRGLLSEIDQQQPSFVIFVAWTPRRADRYYRGIAADLQYTAQKRLKRAEVFRLHRWYWR